MDRQQWVQTFSDLPDLGPGRLYFFPHAGGAASFYFPLAQACGNDLTTMAIQYPGRQNRLAEKPLESIGELADRSAEVIAADGSATARVALFGHSMGALVAFEVARRLEARGLELAALFVSGRSAPKHMRNEPFGAMSDEQLLNSVSEMNGTDPGIFQDPEIVRMILPALRADYTAVSSYVPPDEVVLRCPIFAYAGDDDDLVDRRELLLWSEHTSDEFAARMFPGGHFYLTERREELAHDLRSRLRDPRDLAREGAMRC